MSSFLLTLFLHLLLKRSTEIVLTAVPKQNTYLKDIMYQQLHGQRHDLVSNYVESRI